MRKKTQEDTIINAGTRKILKQQKMKAVKRNWELYLFILPAVLFIIMFNYVPIYGLQLAFKKMIPGQGIFSGSWVGLEHFRRFFNLYSFKEVLLNTIGLSLYQLVVLFPLPIILAIMLNQLKNGYFKRFTQTITYAPFFISTVVLVAMFKTMMSPVNGVINHIIIFLGGESIHFFGEPSWGKSLYVLTGAWQATGWNAVIYLAALTALDPMIVEAATIDGASRYQKIIHIEIPTIMPTISILLIITLGRLMNLGAGKMLLFQNGMNLKTTEIISTYVYRVALRQGQYEFGTAVSLFNTVINFVLLLFANSIARKFSDTSLF